MLVFGFLGFALGFQHIAEGNSATDSLGEDVINVTDVTDVTEKRKKVLVIYSNPCRSCKFFTPPQPSPRVRGGSKKSTNDLGWLYSQLPITNYQLSQLRSQLPRFQFRLKSRPHLFPLRLSFQQASARRTHIKNLFPSRLNRHAAHILQLLANSRKRHGS